MEAMLRGAMLSWALAGFRHSADPTDPGRAVRADYSVGGQTPAKVPRVYIPVDTVDPADPTLQSHRPDRFRRGSRRNRPNVDRRLTSDRFPPFPTGHGCRR
ncbi:hypothetical protein Pen02_10470 [Plantactinospora endophytica]|uniref:Secreted protein n=1 Tax=Plantactinospora endophytica TaxID=673535 RepID=A0ABQ4DUJ1_9ACTN|nr:hypothetical protein Pen02_10470 [Plantactinospora endophytica]